MNKVLIIVTSGETKKAERIYTGSDEWTDGWQLDSSQDYAVRGLKPEIKYLQNLDALIDLGCTEDRIVWVKGKKKREFPTEALNEVLTSLSQNCEVYFAYHDDFVETLLSPSNLGNLKKYSHYGLRDKGQFDKVLEKKNGGWRLNHAGDYAHVFEVFFLAQSDVIGFLKHKLVGMFASVDIDLQGLMETDFDEAYWKEVAEEYGDGTALNKIEQCRRLIYSTTGLKSLYEAEVAGGGSLAGGDLPEITKLWYRVNALLPENEGQSGASAVRPNDLKDEAEKKRIREMAELYQATLWTLEGLSCSNQAMVRDNFKNGNKFHEWLQELNDTIDEMREVLMEKQLVNS